MMIAVQWLRISPPRLCFSALLGLPSRRIVCTAPAASPSATPTPAHAGALAQWLDLAGRTAQAVLACRVEQPMTLAPRIRAVPWHLAWC